MENGKETQNGSKGFGTDFPDNNFTDEELDDIIKENTIPGSSVPESLAQTPMGAAGCIWAHSWLACCVFFFIGLAKGELWCIPFLVVAIAIFLGLGVFGNRWEKYADAVRDKKLATIRRAHAVERAYYAIKKRQQALYGTPDIAYRLYCSPAYKYLDPAADVEIYKKAEKILLGGEILSFSELTDFRLTETAETKSGAMVRLSELTFADAAPRLDKLSDFDFAPADDDKDNPEIDFLKYLRVQHATTTVDKDDIKERRYTGEATTSRADCPVLRFDFSTDTWTADETARLLFLAIAQGRKAHAQA